MDWMVKYKDNGVDNKIMWLNVKRKLRIKDL